MKLSKSFMKKMLILILSVFVLVPIILMVFGLDKPKYEGFFNMGTDGYDSDSDVPTTKITGIRAPGMDVNDNSYGYISNADYKGINPAKSRFYCILGDISCTNGYTRTADVSHQGVSMFKCISGGTVDNTMAKCSGSIFSDAAPFKGNNTVPFFTYDSDGCAILDSSHTTLTSFEDEYGSSLGISGDLSNFTSAYNGAPLEFTNDGSYDYVIFKNPHKGGKFNDISYTTCGMFYGTYECQGKNGCSYTSGSSEDDDDADDTSDGNRLNTKCLGDFGDGVGDKLCCGQTGVIQNEHAKYTCPESHPYCRGYKCGESWGACYSVEDED